MKKYDVNRIKASLTGRMVADALGLETKRIGSKVSILCPDHASSLGKADRKFGNCFLDDLGYCCFACGAKGDMVQLAMAVEGYGFREAVSFLAEAAGGKSYFVMDEKARVKRQPLSKKELECIGLVPGRRPVYLALGPAGEGTKGEGRVIRQHDIFDGSGIRKDSYAAKAGASVSLDDLYAQDKEAYLWLVQSKANAVMEESRRMAEHVRGNPYGTMLLLKMAGMGPEESQGVISAMGKEYRDRYHTARNILRKLA